MDMQVLWEKSQKKEGNQKHKRLMEHHHYSSHMVSVSDGSLQGTDSCLGLLMDQTQPSKARGGET